MFELKTYVGPFKVLAKVGKVAYRLELPQELSRVHHTFHVSNLKKCYADEPLVMPLEGIHVDDKLQFVEEPVEIMEREIKRLKRSRIPLVKVRWNSRRGPEFTWEREDSFKQKYPQLFTNRASSSTTRELPAKALQVTNTGCRLFPMGASFTQGTISNIPIGGSISPEGFLSSILLLVVIIVTVVIVIVILTVVVVDDVSLILKLSLVIIGFLHRIMLYYLIH
ncbi:hypothetical protein Tco_1490599 [Tanacetum coccineum]